MTRATRILDELATISVRLLLQEPFYAHLLSSLNKQVVGPEHEVETLAVGLEATGYVLYVNADFWDKNLSSSDHRYGVLKHELLHLVFRHHAAYAENLDERLQNVAFDLVVNQYIERTLLPDDSIFLASFPDLRLQEGQTWFYYYQQLVDLRRQDAPGDGSGTPDQVTLENIKSDSHGMDRHQPWRNLRQRDALDKSVAETHLDSLLRTAHQRTTAAAWGALPGDVREVLKPLLQAPPPQLNWRRTLRQFAKSASRTHLQNTIRRPSKRYGTTPGLRIARKQRLLVAVDTSGSIGEAEAQAFFEEIFQLWRTGVQVTVVECDTRIQQRYEYQGKTPNVWHGRGGTDFDAPLALANAEQPDALIYFTDGYANKPATQPRVPVLWLITPAGIEPAHPYWQGLPGRKIKMH